MHGCKPVDTPLPGGWRKEDATSAEVVDATVYRQLVGSLMYLFNTRPDICYAVNQLSQAMVKPTKLFWKAGKHVLRYIRGTSGYGSWYRQEEQLRQHGFTDWYHHIRYCVQRRIMMLSYVPTEDQDADILTKALIRSKFEFHRGRIGVADNPYLAEREC